MIFLQSQTLFCKTNKSFWLYLDLTKYFLSNPNPNPNANNQIRVTRFQQPGTRFLNRVISQLTTQYRKYTNAIKVNYPEVQKVKMVFRFAHADASAEKWFWMRLLATITVVS